VITYSAVSVWQVSAVTPFILMFMVFVGWCFADLCFVLYSNFYLCGVGCLLYMSVLLSDEQERSLSKFLSGLLRHFPDEYGLEIYANGWADWGDVCGICGEKFDWFDSECLSYVVECDEKGRYEMREGEYIRALYGHSIDVSIEGSESCVVPDVLFHGTAERNVESILDEGLKSMGRSRVHLSDSEGDAVDVGARHASGDGCVVVFEVDAEGLCEEYVVENPQEGVYTVDEVPVRFLDGKREVS
jgi:putative RNA 2'-phosphotransferase